MPYSAAAATAEAAHTGAWIPRLTNVAPACRIPNAHETAQMIRDACSDEPSTAELIGFDLQLGQG